MAGRSPTPATPGRAARLDRLAERAGLLLAEASFRDGDENPHDLHLTGREAGDVAARNGVPRLVVTHVPPWYDVDDMLAEAKAVYDGELTAAVPGAAYTLG